MAQSDLSSAAVLAASLAASLSAGAPLTETVPLKNATALIEHRNAAGDLLGSETVSNVITTVGVDFLHLQGYGSSGLGANGLNYIALSNDPVTETSASTTLSNEIVANGLARAQGTVAHTNGTNTSTITHVFTCVTAPQAAQKAALFTASSSGVMCHVLGFTQRSLQITDSLSVQYLITLG